MAGKCEFTLEWRPIPTQDPKLVLNLIDKAIEEEKRNDSEFNCEVNCGRNDSGFETSERLIISNFPGNCDW